MPHGTVGSGPNGPSPDLGQFIVSVQRQINELQRQIDSIFPPGTLNMGSHNAPRGDIYCVRVETTYPHFAKIMSQTLTAPQPGTDLLIDLNEDAITTLSAGRGRVGDVFQLILAGTITGLNGQSASIAIGTRSAGTFITLPTNLVGASVGTFFTARALFTVAASNTMNADAGIQGFRGGSVIAGGASVTGIPFNLAVDETFTVHYTTADLASITINELAFSQFA